MIEIVDSPFEPEAYYQKARAAAPHAGALVMFTGLVRDLYQFGVEKMYLFFFGH